MQFRDRCICNARSDPEAPPSVLEPVFLDLVVDRLERQLQELRGLALVAPSELESLGNEPALDVGERVADGDLDDRGLAPPLLGAGKRTAEDRTDEGRTD